MTYHKYSEKDIDIIVKAVRKSPHNLTNAFALAAEKIGGSPVSIKRYYYRVIAPNKDNKLFLTISRNKHQNNYKVYRKGMKKEAKPTGNKKSKWRRILDILFE